MLMRHRRTQLCICILMGTEVLFSVRGRLDGCFRSGTMVPKGEHALSHEESVRGADAAVVVADCRRRSISRSAAASPARNVPRKCFFCVSACVTERGGEGVCVAQKTLCGSHKVWDCCPPQK